MNQIQQHEIDPATEAAVRRFLSLIAGQYDVNSAIPYGSWARGDHHPESDADVAVLLNGAQQQFHPVLMAMSDVAVDVLLETGIDISPLPVWLDVWKCPETYSNPALLRIIAKESVQFNSDSS
jgi:predicted nucleotidyltransferase